MAKPVVQSIRATQEMDDAIELLAKIYNQDIQDIYRLALSEFIISKRHLINDFKKRYQFKEIFKNQWAYNKSTKFVKWEDGQFGHMVGTLVEFTSDGYILESKYSLPMNFEKIRKLVNEADIDEKLDENGIVYSGEGENKLEENSYYSETLIIEVLCDQYGERIERTFSSESDLNDKLRNIYDIHDRVSI